MRQLHRYFASLLFCILPLATANAVDIITHRDVKVRSITLANARAIFGMRMPRWPDGTLVRVFVLPDQHPLHSRLSKEKLDLYPYQLRQTWERLLYSGMAQAPVEVGSEEEMLSRVAATPGAIGYVGKVRKYDPINILEVE